MSARLADYIYSANWDTLPQAVRDHSTLGVANILGSMLGGCGLPELATIDDALSPFSGPQTAVVVGKAFRRDPLHACLLNGISANIRTFDDTHAEAVVHPSAAIAAALMSACSLSRVSGREFLLAYALGVEITCRLSKAISVAPGKSNFGWSQTGICTAIGAAVAAAKCLRLSAEAVSAALTVAATQASGLRVSQSTIVSPMMCGHSAQVGVRAAVLADRGIKGKPNALEGQYGFIEAFSDACDFAILADELGSRFEMLRNLYKPYPCGVVIHSVIDACLGMRETSGIGSKDIRSISIRVNPLVMALTDRRHPESSLAAQVSVYHWTAACFLKGEADLRSVDLDLVNDPEVRRLRDAITLIPDEAIPSHATEVDVETAKGHLHQRVDVASGSDGKPMTAAQIKRKFLPQARLVFSEELAERTYAACLALQDHDDMHDFSIKYLSA